MLSNFQRPKEVSKMHSLGESSIVKGVFCSGDCIGFPVGMQCSSLKCSSLVGHAELIFLAIYFKIKLIDVSLI